MRAYLDRRHFLARSGLAGGALIALGSAACREAAESAAEDARVGAPPRVLTTDELRLLEAVADRIIPPEGDAPGAGGMGAAVFMDHYLARQEETLGAVRAAIPLVEAAARTAAGGSAEGVTFASLPTDLQDDALRDFEEHPSGLFGLLHFLTAAGAFAAPALGGNRAEAGWALLGYQSRGAWQPPFGAYDAAGEGPAPGDGA